MCAGKRSDALEPRQAPPHFHEQLSRIRLSLTSFSLPPAPQMVDGQLQGVPTQMLTDTTYHSETDAIVEPGTTVDQDQPTTEVLIYRRYTQLKTQAKHLMDEADAIKETEIIPEMECGVVFSEGDGYLRFEYSTEARFDFQAAYKNGHISEEVWKQYSSVSVTRKVMTRKLKDDTQAQAEQQLAKKVADLIKAERKAK